MFSKPQQALAKQISRMFQISLIQSQKETENKQANTVHETFTTLYMNAT